MSSTRQQPPWQAPLDPPSDSGLPPLKIWNSLTRSKKSFIPIDWKNRTVTFYSCGPTVYDDAHLGHARNYCTTDIIRRILRSYFQFKVCFVMNITDVDDKIIVRGRQQHLLEEFNNHRLHVAQDILGTRLAALEAYISKNLSRIPSHTSPKEIAAESQKQYVTVLSGGSLDGGAPGDKEAKIKMHIRTLSAASNAMIAHENAAEVSQEYQNSLDDILMPYLDSLYGPTIDAKDHSIFTKLTRRYERRFMEDVRALNCLDPDEITRVTEYGPQIVKFVEKIQSNQYAYETSEGSVYFDINAFEQDKNNYARLQPWNRNDTALQADGEGALTSETSEKRSPADFALWKSSKPGEPSWPSPWGAGRPGWHIECSAMASDKLGGHIDIHSGGVDLAFPHHDNELAQSEAYWLDKSGGHQHQWVNYFIHMGHLSIAGSKMSKSLKNFTTIRDALGRGDWTPRGLRIIFLLGGWKEGIEITDDLIKEGSSWEEKLNNFFIRANDVQVDSKEAHGEVGQQPLVKALDKARGDIFTALCDSFNTPAAMRTITELVTTYNSAEKAYATPAVTLRIAEYVTEMVRIFGLDGTTSHEDKTIGWSGLEIPETGKEILTKLSQLRDNLRSSARSSKEISQADIQAALAQFGSYEKNGSEFEIVLDNFKDHMASLDGLKSPSEAILQLCDRVRDVDLWDRGIYLEDRDGNQPALVRPVTKELRVAKQQREVRDREKQRAKEEREKEAAAKADKGRLSHLDLFKTDEFSAWDEDGIPIKDREGEEITKSRAKKLRKDWERQKKLHEAWVKSNNA